MTGPIPTPYHRDPRGNPLEAWASSEETAGEHTVFLRGPVEVPAHLKALGLGYRQMGRRHVRGSGWTDAVRGPGALRPTTAEMLDALAGVLVLKPPRHMQAMLALDWYKHRDPNVDPRQWSNTEAGQLVHECKHRSGNGPELVQRYGRELRRRCCEVMCRHPLYDGSTVVLDVPGSDPERVSVASRLAKGVATALGKDFHSMRGDGRFRPQAKSLTPELRALLPPRVFTVEADLQGQDVCIVDDVLLSGSTMTSAAEAAWRAGAQRVVGICATRTVRGR